ncbi:protein ABHD13-like [Physella acuta]|uniref:protein ABHD13-like n=1 Tax=Physella acuta TaxID=109671 RepID=UPI0027DB9DA8|nr:protein ABHD13-like [Physella acuta]
MVIFVRTSSDESKSPLVTEIMPSRGRNFFKKCLATIEILVRLALMIVSRFWKMCTTGLLIVTLLFWTEGGTYAFCFFIFGVFGLMYHAQDMLLYHPESPPDSRMIVLTPDAFQMQFENHFIRTKDGTRINVVLIKQMQRAAVTVVFFHGNAGNIGHRLQNALGIYTVLNANVLMVEYRGYGKSEGSVSESGLYQDAEAAMDFLLKRSDIDQSQIVVFGRSLGGAVAIYLASTPFYGPKIAALVLENTFTSIYEMSHKILRLTCIKYIPRWCYKNKYPSIQRIDAISTPVLFLSGTMDELVPAKMMKELYNKSKSSMKRLELFANGTHNDTWMCPGYYEAWLRFIPEALRIRASSSNEDKEYSLGSVMSI